MRNGFTSCATARAILDRRHHRHIDDHEGGGDRAKADYQPALLTQGHYSWSLDLRHQQRLRDVMGIEIGDGTAQIMKMIIARSRLAAAGS
jgi:hypothetical protein